MFLLPSRNNFWRLLPLANEALARIENQQELNAAQTRDGLVDLSETNIASVSQFSSGVLNKIDVDLVTQTETITAALAQIELAQSQLMETVTGGRIN